MDTYLSKLHLSVSLCVISVFFFKLTFTTTQSDYKFAPRSAKQRLARQLRDKEEEIESQNQKVEALRLEVRKAERAKKEVE